MYLFTFIDYYSLFSREFSDVIDDTAEREFITST